MISYFQSCEKKQNQHSSTNSIDKKCVSTFFYAVDIQLEYLEVTV
jgi:hypothetical protein